MKKVAFGVYDVLRTIIEHAVGARKRSMKCTSSFFIVWKLRGKFANEWKEKPKKLLCLRHVPYVTVPTMTSREEVNNIN